MEKWFIIILLLIGCTGGNNKWSSETQENFKKDCKNVNFGEDSNKYCDCIIKKLMQQYDEQSFKTLSLRMLEGNSSPEFMTSWVDVVTECE